jgi:6-pyruvoyltetrahydropterin/6-carboxytetrahydropterin synthase
LILPVVNTTAEEIAWFILNQIRERTLGLFSDAVTEIEVAVDENQGQWGVCRSAWSLQTTQTN